MRIVRGMPSSDLKRYFGSTLHSVIKENGMTLAEAGKASGTIESQFTRWKKGKWQSIPEDRLVAVLDAVCKTPEQRSQCIQAFCMDMIPACERPNILFSAKPKPVLDQDAAVAAWNAEMNLKFKAICTAVTKDEEFKRLFETVAGWARRIAAA